MRWIALVALVALAAWAGTVVDQGSPGKSGSWVVMTSATNNVSISGHFDIILLNN